MVAGRVKTLLFDINTTGSAGSATGTGTSIPINGHILAVQLDYNALAPATTDVVITSDNPSDTILSKSNTATDVIHYPRNIVTTNAGATAVTGDNLFYPFVIQGSITAAVADCDALSPAIEIRIYYV